MSDRLIGRNILIRIYVFQPSKYLYGRTFSNVMDICECNKAFIQNHYFGRRKKKLSVYIFLPIHSSYNHPNGRKTLLNLKQQQKTCFYVTIHVCVI